MCTGECVLSWCESGIRSPGTGVPGSREQPDRDAGNKMRFSARAGRTPDFWPTSLATGTSPLRPPGAAREPESAENLAPLRWTWMCLGPHTDQDFPFVSFYCVWFLIHQGSPLQNASLHIPSSFSVLRPGDDLSVPQGFMC